jgi:hypothetical protein
MKQLEAKMNHLLVQMIPILLFILPFFNTSQKYLKQTSLNQISKDLVLCYYSGLRSIFISKKDHFIGLFKS